MKQFNRFKARHPDCILLFRMGDFYETFDDDAVAVSKALGLTLTQRTEGVPMAGVPYHQLEVYLRRLIAQGFRVAVCDQVQDPREAKGIVERDVTRVLTPGTLVDEGLLEDGAPCRLAAVSCPPMLSGSAPVPGESWRFSTPGLPGSRFSASNPETTPSAGTTSRSSMRPRTS